MIVSANNAVRFLQTNAWVQRMSFCLKSCGRIVVLRQNSPKAFILSFDLWSRFDNDQRNSRVMLRQKETTNVLKTAKKKNKK